MSKWDATQWQAVYDELKKWFTIVPPIVCPVLLVVDAPFGRFTPSRDSIFLLDGIKSWILMELVSPLAFTYTFVNSLISMSNFGASPPLSLSNPSTFLASLFITHYINRALVSPLRTPSRSRSHAFVPLAAVIFNLANGFLMGAYLSSPLTQSFLEGAFSRPLFWFGVGLWAVGFAGNILHDEILLNLRRNAKAKGKDKAGGKSKNKQEHYAIPHGYLYSFISYPNYFCEWLEWLGFTLAASPLPSLSSPSLFLSTLTPPFIFFLSEIWLMIPRAYRGHQWYHQRFPDYPKQRKVVIPFLF